MSHHHCNDKHINKKGKSSASLPHCPSHSSTTTTTTITCTTIRTDGSSQPTTHRSQHSLSPHIKSVCIIATTSVTDTKDSSHSPSHSSTISTKTITSTTIKTDGSSQPATHQSAVLIATYHECLYCRHNKCYRYKGFITFSIS